MTQWMKGYGSRTRPRLELLEARHLLAGSPVITEFVASNGDSLLDGNGESSDWIEVLNAGDEPVDLHGFHLSDDPDNLSRWAFPENTVLQPGEYLVVFASGAGVPDTKGGLHTNFRLSASGEYLGLSSPDGTVLSEFGTSESDYPKQFRDVSFGLGPLTTTDVLIDGSSPANVLVPNSNGLGTNWTTSDYIPDASWIDGTNGIGYGFDGPRADGVVLQVDFNDDDSGESGDANTEEGWQTFNLSQNGSSYDGITVTLSGVGDIPLDDRDRATPTDDPPALTYDQIFDDFIFGQSQTNGTGIELAIDGLLAGQDYEITLWSFDAGSIGTRVSNWNDVTGGVPISIESNYAFAGASFPASDLDNTMSAILTADADGSIKIQGTRNGGTSYGVFLNGLRIAVPNSNDIVQTDLQSQMQGQQSTSYVRLPFSIPADVSYDQLSLQLQFDAGYVAYLNGQEVSRSNFDGVPSYDSVASSERTVDQTLQPALIALSDFTELLQEGQNVLAIHGINSSSADDDFLIRAELIGTQLNESVPIYYANPTPGAQNAGETFEGFVTDTKFSVDRGFYTSAFEVEVTTETPGASIIYTTDGSEPSENNGTIVVPLTANSTPIATVPVTTTSYIRAVAIKENFLSSNIDTQTYIFLDDVLQQDPLANPNGLEYPTRWQANAVADYEIDPEVVAEWDDNNPDNDDYGIRDALTSIPTMSIVMDHDDLWSGTDGIYRNSNSRGERWKKPGSIEYFDPNTGEEFQVNAGVQIHGGASRDNVRLKKHSFRLVFRSDFGPGTLNYPLFDDTENEEFNTLVLRAFFTDSFATRTITDRYNPIESQYLRDVWMKDTQMAMGNPSTHNTYVHLYINGLYWGLYNPAERPDEAFLATYLGGEREDWDIVKDFNELFAGQKTAWNEMFALARDLRDNPTAIYQQLQGNDPDGTRNPEMPVYLDMDNLIDFMILHLHAGVEDWPHHNWYAGRNRVDPGKGFKFFVWDQEIGVDQRYRDRTTVRDSFTPAELYHHLRTYSPEFRQRFADRVQKHLYAGGALTVEANQERWMARANEIEKAMIGESARWGDAREGERHRLDSGGPLVTIPVMTVDLWREERERVINSILPTERELFLERLAEIDLVAPIAAPQFNQHGGAVPTGFDLEISAPQDPFLVETPLVTASSSVRVLVPQDGSLDAVGNQAPAWTVAGFNDSDWISGQGGVGHDTGSSYRPLLGVDLLDESIPSDKSTDSDGDGSPDRVSVYTRYAFQLDANFDSSAFDAMILDAKFDDGFAAYLNGTLIHSQFAPDPAVWDARATRSSEADVNEFERFDVSEHISLLDPSIDNVLAIHLFNRTPASNDLLIVPRLVVGEFQEVDQAPVYFTIDGNDPRLDSGEINAQSAALYQAPIGLNQTTHVKARALINGNWSALTEATFNVNPAGPDNLMITEINYNPHEPTAIETGLIPSVNNDDFEFIELFNRSSTETISLLGMRFDNGITFEFPQTTLSPGEYAVVVSNQAAFEARYSTTPRVIGQWTGGLANDGERIRLRDADGNGLFDFEFNDNNPWPSRADGAGGTLELIDSQATPVDQFSKYYRWHGSTDFGGSPGAAGMAPIGIVVNEVVARTIAPNTVADSIELFNTTSERIDIGGWYLSDTRDNFLKYRIPDATTIEPGSYLVFDESHFNPNPLDPGPNDFALDGIGGDDVWLVIPDQNEGVASFVDDVHFGAMVGSFGRTPNGSGRLAPMTESTLGAANASPQVGSVVISEFNYNPGTPTAAALAIYPSLTGSDLEFVELHNASAQVVDLNEWRLRGGIDTEFGTVPLDVNQSVVVLSFNPNSPNNVERLAAFRAHYGIDESVRLVGGYRGQINNDGERIELQRPGDPAPDEPESIPYLMEDEVLFDDLAPWPVLADGSGTSLHRKAPEQFGNSANSWDSAQPSPGEVSFVSIDADFNKDGATDITDLDLLCSGIHEANVAFDLNGDNVINTADLNLMVDSVLNTVIGDTNLDRLFNSTDLIKIFQAGEYEDEIVGNSVWSEGDWNCDGDFDTSDLVTAFRAGTYTSGAVRAVVADGAGAIANTPDEESKTRERRTPTISVALSNALGRRRLLDSKSIDLFFERS